MLRPQCNPLKKKWQEFHAQGDLEASLGLPISPLCDRKDSDLAGSQIGFSKFVVRPFYALCSQLFVGLEPILKICDENISIWNEKKQLDDMDKNAPTGRQTSEVEDLKEGHVIGLDKDAMQAMTDEEVALP